MSILSSAETPIYELQVGGDPRQTPNEYIEFCRDADILIHDSQYTPEEIDGRKGWGHSDYRSSFDSFTMILPGQMQRYRQSKSFAKTLPKRGVPTLLLRRLRRTVSLIFRRAH